jgi:hypothetical protein
MLRIMIGLFAFSLCAAAAVKEQSGRNSTLVVLSELAFGALLMWAVLS